MKPGFRAFYTGDGTGMPGSDCRAGENAEAKRAGCAWPLGDGPGQVLPLNWRAGRHPSSVWVTECLAKCLFPSHLLPKAMAGIVEVLANEMK